MVTHRIAASQLIHAPADRLYSIIADYQQGHTQIIPRPPFVSLEVEQGGIGAGTVIRVQMRMLGQTQTFHSTVTEPEPGRVLVETNDNGYVTTFTVDPRAEGQQAYVNNRDGRYGACWAVWSAPGMAADASAATGVCAGA